MQKLLIILFLFLNLSTFYGQDKNTNFGIKAGLNYANYTANKQPVDYQYKFGFYAGGFFNISLEKKLEFQPELIFALQGSRVLFEGLYIPNFNISGFEYEVNEFTIAIPLVIKAFLFKKFYLEGGPQFGFIVDRTLNTSLQLIDGEDESFVVRDGDLFDFGISLGFGQQLSERLSINIRSFSGLIKRDNGIKSFVFNLGIEYNL